MTSLSRRLLRLEATSARLDLSAGARELEQFSRSAEEYIHAVRQYLGEPPDLEMTISCRNASERLQVVNQMAAYRVRSLRHYSRQRNAYAGCAEAT